jgi:hypothetical protein
LQKFTIRVARVEKTAASPAGDDICLTFRFERGPIGFDLPVVLNSSTFDDTELVQVARSRLSEIFLQLAAQSETWKLSSEALSALARLNRRPSTKK